MLFFPATYQACMSLVIDDAIVVVKGRLDRREDVPKLVAMEVSAPEMPADGQGPFVVSMHGGHGACRRSSTGSGRYCGPIPGPTEVHLRLLTGSRTKVVRLDDKLRVRPSPSLLADLKQLLGPPASAEFSCSLASGAL